ncbi:MAG: sugar kinase [Pseudobutyrivibrio sp.]|nr:sugar kinase [Pseudobutyrivibrio sp.]
MSNTNRMLDVICLGAAVVDIPLRPVSKDIFNIESYPVDNIAMTIGGDALNEATIISRLGFKTGVIAAIGNDAAGQHILQSCKADNIDIEGITIDPEINTSINIGLVTEDGERTFITNRNGSLWKENIKHVDFEKMKQCRILSLASIFNCPLLDGKALVEIFKEAKKAGLIITADMIMPRLQETLDDIKEALSFVDYFFPNYDEACILTNETEESKVAEKLYNCGIKNVVMKIGKRGCYIKNKDGDFIVPACKDVVAIDTIGAGDNFASGFIAGLLQGKNINGCAIYANCTAAVSVQYAGATGGVKKKQDVEDMFNKYIKDYDLRG